MSATKISVDEVNNLKPDQFEKVFGNVIELYADAAKTVGNKRPFQTALEFCKAFQGYLDDLSVEAKMRSMMEHSCLEETDVGAYLRLEGTQIVYIEKHPLSSKFYYFPVHKLVVLKLHPDLAGRLAAQGELTPESTCEQKAAGLHELTAADKKTIDESNRRYKDKFGFPFIICARENKVQSIIAGLRIRYDNSPEEEINIGINEVKKICKLRILDIVKDA